MAFIARACPSTKAMPWAAHRPASQYHVNMHSAATTRSSRYGATISRNAAGVVFTLRCTSTWPVASRMQTYMVLHGDRFRNSDGAAGCRIASVLLLRGCALALRQPTGNQQAAGGGLNQNPTAAAAERRRSTEPIRPRLDAARG